MQWSAEGSLQPSSFQLEILRSIVHTVPEQLGNLYKSKDKPESTRWKEIETERNDMLPRGTNAKSSAPARVLKQWLKLKLGIDHLKGGLKGLTETTFVRKIGARNAEMGGSMGGGST